MTPTGPPRGCPLRGYLIVRRQMSFFRHLGFIQRKFQGNLAQCCVIFHFCRQMSRYIATFGLFSTGKCHFRCRDILAKGTHWAVSPKSLAEIVNKFSTSSGRPPQTPQVGGCIVRTSMHDLSAPFHHWTRPWTHSGAYGAASSRD